MARPPRSAVSAVSAGEPCRAPARAAPTAASTLPQATPPRGWLLAGSGIGLWVLGPLTGRAIARWRRCGRTTSLYPAAARVEDWSGLRARRRKPSRTRLVWRHR